MVNSSLSYEVLLYLNSYYFGMFFVCELGMLVFKGVNLPYPTGVYVTDFVMLVFLSCVESLRIFLGRKGNMTERSLYILISIGFTVPAVLGVVYFLLWQTYILRIEVILCWIQLTIQAIELIFSLLCLSTFYRLGTY